MQQRLLLEEAKNGLIGSNTSLLLKIVTFK